MPMWEPFPERTRRVFVRAQEKARERRSGIIDVGDFLSAVAEREDQIGLLVRGSVDFTQLEAERAPVDSSEPMTFAAGVKRMIEFSFEEARSFGDDFVGSAALVLGALRVDPPVPLQPGVDLAEVRRQLAALRFADAPPAT